MEDIIATKKDNELDDSLRIAVLARSRIEKMHLLFVTFFPLKYASMTCACA